MSEANGEYPPVSGWVVQIQPGVWLAPWRGDPGRTLVIESAKQFKTAHAGECALRQARRWRPFAGAFVYQPNDQAQILSEAK
jgi:hypothetical protein